MQRIASAATVKVTQRSVRDSDADDLFRLFVAAREDLQAAVSDWDAALRENFFRQQFHAQQKQYRSRFPAARHNLIIVEGESTGQIRVDIGTGEICLVDVSLLPEYRNLGIGSAVLRQLLAEAAAADKPVNLHVVPDNPAVRLYRRLGFEDAGTAGAHLRMVWMPPTAAGPEET